MPPLPATQHPGNDYYVNPLTGTIQRQSNPILAAGLKATGWQGPFTWAQAKATVAGLQAGIGAATPGGLPTIGPGGNIGGTITNPLGGIQAIGDFFNRLTQPHTWVRVGEVLGGLLLVYMGLRASFSGTEAEKAVNTVTKPVKKGVSTVASVTPAGRALKTERTARKIARQRNIRSAAGKRATVIRKQQRARAS